MTNVSNPISSVSTLVSGTGTQSSSSSSSTADIISSFKEILSVMTATGSLSSSDQASGTGMNMGSMMAPMMLLMIEKLLELEVNQDAASGSTQSSTATSAQSGTLQASGAVASTAASGVMGSKPTPSGWPVTGRISQEPHTGHMAFDIAIPVGTQVKTTMDGKVVYAGWNNQGYGNLVIVENGGYRTYYGHLSSVPVSVGEQVTAGTVIGLSGNTGHSTGPHLHYEIRQNGVAIDPTALTRSTSSLQ
jgi:murein DD-endopeptidase MepM/ murein hydrolase activator NlpD